MIDLSIRSFVVTRASVRSKATSCRRIDSLPGLVSQFLVGSIPVVSGSAHEIRFLGEGDHAWDLSLSCWALSGVAFVLPTTDRVARRWLSAVPVVRGEGGLDRPLAPPIWVFNPDIVSLLLSTVRGGLVVVPFVQGEGVLG